MRSKISILFFLITLASFAQGEANIWYFGENAGLDFNSGTPVALTNGQLNTQEGCATISNGAGQLLFYTDGITVWDRNHLVMPNGTDLFGHPSSSHAATIVPLPGSATLFYVFTLDAFVGVHGFCYSIVDMSLNGGNGDVTSKNVQIYTPANEKLSIVKHANNSDYWVVTHEWNSNNFVSHLLTSSGLSATPVISSIGATISGSTDNVLGQMKISPDGTKLAVCHLYDQVELFNFDVTTGIVSNHIVIYDTDFNYGVEFSPNSEVLYITNLRSSPESYKILQFDMNATNIPASVQTIYYSNNYVFFGIQLGPDGKIYVTQTEKLKLAVIHNPNQVGLGCNFQQDAVDLGGKKCKLGLPPFVSSFFFTPAIQFQNACVGATTQFQLGNATITSANWDFGDGNTSTSLSPTHTYTTAGTYNVTVSTTSPSGSGSATREIVISTIPSATQPINYSICDNNNDGFYSFDLTSKNLAILNGQSTTQYGVRYFANATDYANNIAIANPTSFQNATAYQLQTIIAEVYNLANDDCKATTTFTIQVFESPLPSTTISPIQLCDNTSFGTDVDGKVVFNLTNNQTTILNGQSATDFSLSYYKDVALTNLISNPTTYVNTNVAETIYVKMTNNQNVTCFATTSFQIEVYSLPSITSPIPLKQCDDNNDGFSAFNLTEANELVVASTSGLTFSYFETLAEAQSNSNPILNFTAYTNQTVSTDQVFIRIQNTNGCYRVATLNLIVSTTLIPANFQKVFTVCDDTLSGSNSDGIATFNFSSATADIQALYPAGQVLDITYYQTVTDALAEQNPITNTSSFTNTNSPTTQNIFVRVDSQLDNECLGLGHHITLKVEPLPIISPLSFTHCDDDQDGSFGFETSNLATTLLSGLTNVTLTYWDENNNSLPSPLPNPFNTTTQIVKVRATNNTTNACYFETNITFTVDDLPEAFAIPTNLTTVCDDEANPINQDGLFAFDTSSFQNTILGTQTGMIVNYFDGAGNSLSSPLPNPFVSGTQNITVKVINPINTTCFATALIPLIVNPIPKIELYGDELICSNNPLFTKIINAGLLDETTISNFTYQWFLNGIILPTDTNYDLTVNTEGIYSVEVTNSNGCKRTRTITVTASNMATIDEIEIVDLSDENSVTIIVSGSSLGDYEYSLDGENFQTSNVFPNIASGIYTVYVQDTNGCGVATEEISVLGTPTFFTPNNDGFNDFWNVKGVNSNFNLETTIHIFDRYGKILKQISPLSQGWDGTFNGTPMPSSDYWYAIQLESGRIVKGHFSLKR
jgi:gliding motility-associated-like protein